MNPNDELLEGLPADLPEEADTSLSLDDILKEFSPEDAAPPEAEPIPDAETEPAAQEASGDTLRMELPAKEPAAEVTGDTVRFEPVGEQAEEAAPQAEKPKLQKKEPFTEGWEPDYEQPIGEYVPPQPIIFHPRSRLRELKRKLVAGPEKRYYDLTEIGFGKLQAAIFISILIVLFSACVTVLYTCGMIPPSRIKLMVFLQFLSMLVSALLGCYQIMDGVADLFKLRFSLNTMLLITFAACFTDGILGLREFRVPCCAAFSLHVTMSLLSAYQRRQTELWQMDTMRKATHLDSIVRTPEYHDGNAGLLRGEGQVEDFMDNYSAISGPEKALHTYAFLATLASLCISVVAGLLHSDVSFAVQVLSVTMLVSVPVTAFISFSRPMAILERRLHKLGTVLCGWQGVKRMAGKKVFFPVSHKDLFPAGSCKMNGVKFYGSRDPDQVVAYSTALILADGSGLGSLFEQLLNSRNGRHYDAMNYRAYPNGGIGAEVCQEPVLMGSLAFLQEMGVEIPEGINVNHAIYTAVDGELCGVFAITYNRAYSVAAGLGTLCSYRRVRPVLISCDFILTEKFMKDLFGINPRRFFFPEREVRQELQAKALPEDTTAAALITTEGLTPFAYAVTGARAIRTAAIIGTAVHIIGGVLGLLIMLALAVLGEAALLTPANLLAFELVWLVPGLLISEWTRAV